MPQIKRWLATLLFAFSFLAAWLAACPSASCQDQIDFAHDILPILKSKCAKCHSNGVFKGGLSLETREKLIDSGVVALGDHESSSLFERVTSTDPEEQMPPEGDRLSKSELNKIAAWIDAGLEWPADVSLKRKTFSRSLTLQEVKLPKDATESSHPLDVIIEKYFQANSIPGAERLSDHQFLRRAKLDLLGQLPTAAETGQFAADQSTSKHEQLIVDLLSQKRNYADHWMSFWNDLLRNDYVGTGYIDGGRRQITTWLHRSLLENKPYDQFVTELISPSPESVGFIKGIKWRGEVNASQIEPLQFSQNISQVFLGINMKCASCHDSFIDDWKLDDAYGLAAITAEQPLELHRCDVPTGQIATSRFVFPSVGTIDQNLTREQRLKQLAKLMVSQKNGRFPRTIVNRLWHRMLGRGLVHPVDVMANKAWSEPLLDYLAWDLVQHGYDLKRTLKLIATSKVYRSKSVKKPTTPGEFLFKGVETKRMTAEQLVDSIWSLTDSAPGKVDADIALPGDQPTAKWIWSHDQTKKAAVDQVVTFKHEFELKSLPVSAGAVVSCDNEFTLFLNGDRIGAGKDWQTPVSLNLKESLRVGKNVLIISAINRGKSPNAAALFFEARLASERQASDILLASGASFEWVEKRVDPQNIPADLDWRPAIELVDASEVYQAVDANLRRSLRRLQDNKLVQVRAALVNSDPLMRSLGRPNREQVVTTRPDDLSTLQALDLSNGEILSNWLRQGAKQWLAQKKSNAWPDQEFVSRLFLQSLSRKATPSELDLLTPLNTENEVEAIEDLLWIIVMLPEFQLIQ